MTRRTSLLAAVVALWVTSTAAAQTTEQRGLECLGVGLSFARPAIAEWTDWIGVGSGVTQTSQTDQRTVFALRAGLGVDFSIARIGSKLAYGGQHEIRLGPWLGAETTFGQATLETGFALDFGKTSHASWGDVSLRIGGGAQHAEGAWLPAASATLSWGVRSVRARYSEGGGCVIDDDDIEITNPGEPVATHAFASGVRVFSTLRLDAEGGTSLLFGLEIEPTFLLPPYSVARFSGSGP